MVLSLTIMSFQDHEDEENPESQSPPDRALQPAEVPCEASRLELFQYFIIGKTYLILIL